MKKLSALFLALVMLAGCGKNNNVVTMKSGLQYADDSLGTGQVVQQGDIVAMHYTAWIIKDSTKIFDDWKKDPARSKYLIGISNVNEPPVKYKLGTGQFIRGCDEGIIGMRAGGKRTIIIPAKIAYGDRGFAFIPPNSSIKVVIELVSVIKPVAVKMWDIDTSDVKTTASGLRYVIVSKGSDKSPQNGDTVVVNYSAFLSDGKKFDSSVEREEPLIFKVGVGMVIKGWDEAITLMKKGGKARFIIPPALGYGEQPVGPIPPNSTLIFDIELVDIFNNSASR